MRWSEACEMKRFRYPLTSRHPALVSVFAAGAWVLGATGFHNAIPSADYLYRAGLALSWCGRHRMALRLLGASARRYRSSESVIELARLRASESIVRFREAQEAERRRELNEEIVIRLSRLEEVESPDPPFTCLPADSLLSVWMSRQSFVLGRDGASESATGSGRAAVASGEGRSAPTVRQDASAATREDAVPAGREERAA